jgi:hypothetical protein
MLLNRSFKQKSQNQHKMHLMQKLLTPFCQIIDQDLLATLSAYMTPSAGVI